MTGAEVQALLHKEATNVGGAAEWSRQKGVDPAAVSRALSGTSPPRPAVLRALGLVRKVEYVRAK